MNVKITETNLSELLSGMDGWELRVTCEASADVGTEISGFFLVVQLTGWVGKWFASYHDCLDGVG